MISTEASWIRGHRFNPICRFFFFHISLLALSLVKSARVENVLSTSPLSNTEVQPHGGQDGGTLMEGHFETPDAAGIWLRLMLLSALSPHWCFCSQHDWGQKKVQPLDEEWTVAMNSGVMAQFGLCCTVVSYFIHQIDYSLTDYKCFQSRWWWTLRQWKN